MRFRSLVSSSAMQWPPLSSLWVAPPRGISVAFPRRGVVIVVVRRRVVISTLGFLAPVAVRMNEAAVVVRMLVVVRAVLELAEDTTRIVMRHVIVVVCVDHGLVGVFVLLVAHDTLPWGDALVGHRLLLHE